MKIGVDAGGTKTIATIYQDGIPLEKSGLSGYGNVLINYSESINNIEEAIYVALKKNKLTMADITLVVIGSAGSKASGLQSQMLSHFNEVFSTPIHITDDLRLSHTATFKGDDGVLLIAGTGSAVLSKYQNNYQQKGGWGHILGDEGSGYWLGKQLLTEYLKYFEDSATKLDFEKLLPELQALLPTKNALINIVYNEPKFKVANFASFLAKHSNNLFCQSLLTEAGEHLAILVINSLSNEQKHIQLSTEGSVLNKNQLVWDSFIANLKKYQVTFTLANKADPTSAVCYY